jgi:glycosyltransferase involved in cell wall biosynthesis
MRNNSISVSMASYNGALYIEEQVRSILQQLGENDELLVVDDDSTDDTVDVLLSIGDKRIRILRNETNLGHVATFEKAITEARGDLIFLADQDDVWLPGRVTALREALERKRYAASNWSILGRETNMTAQSRLSVANTLTPWKNVGRIYQGSIAYFGCAMAFRAEARALIIPFPKKTEAHDHWIAIVGNLDGGMAHLADSTVARRLHGNNLTSSRRALIPVLRTRVRLTSLLITAIARAIRSPASHDDVQNPVQR